MTPEERYDDVIQRSSTERPQCAFGTQEGCPGIGGLPESCAYHNLLDRSEHD
jgi:hypothetical protein